MESNLAPTPTAVLNQTPDALSQFLLEIGKRALAESEVRRVLAAAINHVIAVSGAERGMIVLFGESGGNLLVSTPNLAKDEIIGLEFKTSRAIIDRVRIEGAPVCLGDVLAEPALCRRAGANGIKILSIICVPVRHQGKILGVVYLDKQAVSGAFTPRSLQLLQGFADFISLAAHCALERRKLLHHANALETELRDRYHFEAIVGHDPQMVENLKLVAQLANTDATVLIKGESGTGKELIARALHYNSKRKDKPFVPINCGALAENLLESELFGHVRGAFTGAFRNKTGWFERAHGGTIFLDEVSKMSLALQAKLLRILQTGEYSPVGSTELRFCDLRILAATNRDLRELMRQETFREDVYYRLNVIDLELPPLRRRRDDIPLLIQHFIKHFGAKFGKESLRLAREAEALLLAYDFPGNVRELESIIQHAVILAENGGIERRHLPADVHRQAVVMSYQGWPSTFKAEKQRAVEEFEREYIVNRLKAAKGNISRAAQSAGLHLKNFYTKMVTYGINPRSFKIQ